MVEWILKFAIEIEDHSSRNDLITYQELNKHDNIFFFKSILIKNMNVLLNDNVKF